MGTGVTLHYIRCAFEVKACEVEKQSYYTCTKCKHNIITMPCGGNAVRSDVNYSFRVAAAYISGVMGPVRFYCTYKHCMFVPYSTKPNTVEQASVICDRCNL